MTEHVVDAECEECCWWVVVESLKTADESSGLTLPFFGQCHQMDGFISDDIMLDSDFIGRSY